MKKEKLTFEESSLAKLLRGEIFKLSTKESKTKDKQVDMTGFELISTPQKPYISPIFTMNEDEILAFVEEFEVGELATLTTEELDRIGEVLGVDPNSLMEN